MGNNTSSPESHLKLTGTNKCIVEKNGVLSVGDCNNKTNFLFNASGQLNINSRKHCVKNDLTIEKCTIDSQQWVYDPKVGFVIQKKSPTPQTCLLINGDELMLSDKTCSKINYGPQNSFTEIDRNGRCGPSNLATTKLNYNKDDGKCDAGRTCSSFGYCGTGPAYVTGKWYGKYDGDKFYTEADNHSRCGSMYGKCAPGRFCNKLGECQNVKDKESIYHKFDGDNIKLNLKSFH